LIDNFSCFFLEIFCDCKYQQIYVSFISPFDKRLNLVGLNHSLAKPDWFLPKVYTTPLISRQMRKNSNNLAYFILRYYLPIKFLIKFKFIKDGLFYIAHDFQIIHFVLIECKYESTNCLQRMREKLMKWFCQGEQIIQSQIHPQLNNLPKKVGANSFYDWGWYLMLCNLYIGILLKELEISTISSWSKMKYIQFICIFWIVI